MSGRFARVLLSAFLALAIPALTVAHEDETRAFSLSGELAAHHHGPHAPCPKAFEHHCLACAASSLFAPAPAILPFSRPRLQGVNAGSTPGAEKVVAFLAPSGRSPPLFQSV